jgi:hypothetical protein
MDIEQQPSDYYAQAKKLIETPKMIRSLLLLNFPHLESYIIDVVAGSGNSVLSRSLMHYTRRMDTLGLRHTPQPKDVWLTPSCDQIVVTCWKVSILQVKMLPLPVGQEEHFQVEW